MAGQIEFSKTYSARKSSLIFDLDDDLTRHYPNKNKWNLAVDFELNYPDASGIYFEFYSVVLGSDSFTYNYIPVIM